MDTSETYIKMCERAKEIQLLWAQIEPNDGDWFACKRDLDAQGEVYARKGEAYHVSYYLRDYPFCNIYFAKHKSSRASCDMRSVGLYHLNPKNPEGQLKYFELIWLPRQDQLQEMMTQHNLWAKTLAFEFFLRKEGKYDINKYPFQFTSMEQLWLAFVMKEKYGRVWNGISWTKP